MKEETTINISVGNQKISAVLHYPASETFLLKPLIFVHGFVGSKVGEHRLFVKAARYFANQGYLVLRFDFLGCGESDGDYQEVTVTNKLKQLQNVIDYLLSLPKVDREYLTVIGHSLGGAVASLTASIDKRIKRLILWAPVAAPYRDITNITGIEAVAIAEEKGRYDYKGFYVSNAFFEDLKHHHPLISIQAFQGPVLVLHGNLDLEVPYDNALHYIAALKKRPFPLEASFTVIEKADHTFSRYVDENKLFEQTYHWLNQAHLKDLVKR